MSTSSLCALSASLAIHQALRHLLNLGPPVSNTILDYCGYTHAITTSTLVRNPDCPNNHTPFRRVRAPTALRDSTLQTLGQVTGWDKISSSVSFSVEGANWVERGACQCSHETPIRRFMATPNGKPRRCRVCHELISPQPFHTHERVTSSMLGAALNTPLKKLGVSHPRAVLAHQGEQTTLILNPDQP